jgi:hypothetical protein
MNASASASNVSDTIEARALFLNARLGPDGWSWGTGDPVLTPLPGPTHAPYATTTRICVKGRLTVHKGAPYGAISPGAPMKCERDTYRDAIGTALASTCAGTAADTVLRALRAAELSSMHQCMILIGVPVRIDQHAELTINSAEKNLSTTVPSLLPNNSITGNVKYNAENITESAQYKSAAIRPTVPSTPGLPLGPPAQPQAVQSGMQSRKDSTTTIPIAAKGPSINKDKPDISKDALPQPPMQGFSAPCATSDTIATSGFTNVHIRTKSSIQTAEMGNIGDMKKVPSAITAFSSTDQSPRAYTGSRNEPPTLRIQSAGSHLQTAQSRSHDESGSAFFGRNFSEAGLVDYSHSMDSDEEIPTRIHTGVVRCLPIVREFKGDERGEQRQRSQSSQSEAETKRRRH